MALAATTTLFEVQIASLWVYWFGVLPLIAIGVASYLAKTGKTALTAFAGTMLFYAVVLFMTYEHWYSDFYAVLRASFFWNVFFLGSISIIEWVRTTRRPVN